MAIGIIKLAKNLNEWSIFNKWNPKIKTIENQRKKLLEHGYLTHEEATELEELMMEAQKDYDYLLKKKEEEDKLESLPMVKKFSGIL
jgi:hypothetical protein